MGNKNVMLALFFILGSAIFFYNLLFMCELVVYNYTFAYVQGTGQQRIQGRLPNSTAKNR